MPFCVCFDLETRSKIDDVPGRYRDDKVRALQISVLCATKLDADLAVDDPQRAFEQREEFVFWAHTKGDIPRFLQMLDGAVAIGGFNVFGFDFPVLAKHYQAPGGGGNKRYRSHTFKAQDPFSRLRDSTGIWYKLETLLRANGLNPKTANGLQGT